ncbi:MAG: GNVR domain-containing protein [Terracidiphilus sp.]
MIEQNPEIAPEQGPAYTTTSSEESKPPAGLTFFGALTLFARRKRLLAAVSGIAMLIGIAISLLLPVQFTATTKIMTPQQTQSSAAFLMSQLGANLSPASALATASGGTLSLRNPNELYMGLLGSRPIADALIGKFGLMGVYQAKDMTAARKALANNTTITSEKSTLIAISVTDKDKNRAAAMANAYPEQLRALTKNLAMTEASQRRLFYEQRLKDAKEDLVTAELAFQRIEKEKGLVQLDAQAKALIASLEELHAQVAAKEVQLQALRSYSTEQNPEVQLLESQLSSLQEQAAGLEERSGSPASAGLDLGDIAGAGADYLRAEHELAYRQALFDLLLKQYDAARWDEAKNAAVIQVVEEAIPPDRKSAPHRTIIVLVFTALGMLGSWSYLLGRNLVRNHPHVSQLLAEFKSVPVSE